MIINDNSQMLNAEVFSAGMARALRAIVRVQIGEHSRQSICTGWMLTPRITAIPAYAIEMPDSARSKLRIGFTIQALSKGKVAWQEVANEALIMATDDPAGVDPSLRIALVALRRAHKVPRLEFSVTAPEQGSFVSILSFPLGRPRLTLSFGKLVSQDEIGLEYDAGSEPGSGGAPVFDERWNVLGMHMMGNPTTRSNRGISPSTILSMLRGCKLWDEIAAYHGFADLTAGRKRLEESNAVSHGDLPHDALIRAAVRLSVRASALSQTNQEILRGNVVNPAAKFWTLLPMVRQSVIQAVGSIDALRAKAPRTGMSPGQRVINRILAGPPYDLANASDEELSWWIQATRWFAGVAPGLPTPDDVNKTLQRRRVRGRLDTIAGSDFIGRQEELQIMRNWFKQRPTMPLSVSGVGGVGKSALIARFATSLPEQTLLLWLDFDRADLAPDDAVSVIKALAEQASIQLDGFTPPEVTAESWTDDARAFAKGLAARRLRHPPLLVLDSFEMAQYAERYQELWPVLEEIGRDLQALRVIVSGRAPVSTLKLRGRKVKMLPISGLKPAQSLEWLKRHGIRGARVLADIVTRSRGFPLILHLADRLIKAGGRVSDLPKTLPPEILAGFLYDRILDRVQRPDLKQLAMGALVLHRLTEEMIQPIFGGLVDLPPGEPADWFRDLSREAALVDGSGVLRLRPEVRTAALDLLESEQSALVRSIDERAEQWYATQKINDPETAAELVYHRLRLGNIQGASDAWRDGCGTYLQYADEDLDGSERIWLQTRLGLAAAGVASTEAWEHEAAERIRAARLRNLERTVPKILSERTTRTANSALLFHDAYLKRERGDTGAALTLLENAGATSGIIGRERSLLHALLLVDLDRTCEADTILQTLSSREHWKDRQDSVRELAALCAARIRLATDFTAELQLAQLLRSNPELHAAKWVSPIDVLWPELDDLLIRYGPGSDRSSTLKIPGDADARSRVNADIERYRATVMPDEPPELRDLRQRIAKGQSPPDEDWPSEFRSPLRRVLENGWRRWRILSNSALFDHATQVLREDKLSPLDATIIAAYSKFAGLKGLTLIVGDSAHTEQMWLDQQLVKVTDCNKKWTTVTPVLRWLSTKEVEPYEPDANLKRSLSVLQVNGVWLRGGAVVLHFSTPDPLELLVARFAGKEIVNA